MPILKTVIAPNGAQATHHKILTIESHVDQTPGAFIVKVAAYGSEENLQLGIPACQWPAARIPIALLDCSDFVPSIERVLVGAGDSPLLGGALIAPVTDLETAKARRWSEIKALRSAMEFGPLLWDGSTFNGDAVAQTRIQASARRAAAAIAAGEALTEDWTLADNTVRTLTAADLVALGAALDARPSQLHDIARGLRERIDAALTPEEAASVDWPPAETFFQA